MICVPVIIGNRELSRFTTGWMPCFRLADTGNLVREVDKWLRRRLRQVRWKEMEDYRPAAQSADTRYSRAQRPQVGR
jgi:hypothetical protein